MRAKLCAALVVCAGCSSLLGLDEPGAFGGGDAGADAGSDAPPADAQLCYGSGTFAFCLDAVPTSNYGLVGFDTTTSAECVAPPAGWLAAGQPDACFVVARTITLDEAASIAGQRPVVLVASETITLGGLLDVAGHGNTLPGPGGDGSVCDPPGDGQADNNGAGGGAGGSFRSRGARGGTGDAGATTGGTSGLGVAPPTLLRGGCRGGDTTGGVGGGAIYLVAGTSISFQANGAINASGAGAVAGLKHSGGGGGGSGGMIVLWAPTITTNAGGGFLAANGGGGGAGGTANGNGRAGGATDISSPLTPAPGGVALSGGGDGGAGAVTSISAVAGGAGAAGGGGGGGGGGFGYIRSNIALAGITASPGVDVVP